MLALLGARAADECAGFLTPGTFASFRRDVGLSYSHATLILVIAAPGAIAGNVFPILGDHRSRRAIAATGAFCYAVGLTAFGVGHSFALLLAASFMLGFAATALIQGTELALIDAAGEHVTTFFARGMVFGAAGGVLGPALLIGAAATGLGWRVAFLACAAAMAVYGVFLTRLPFPRPTRPERSPLRALQPILRDRRVWICGALALVIAPLQQPFAAFLIAYLERDRHASTVVATSVPIAWVAGSAITALRASRMHTRNRPSLVRSALLLFAATVGAASVPWLVGVVACVGANGVGVTNFFLALKTRIADLYPGRVGSVHAAVTTLEFLGFGLPLIAGVLADAFGIGAGFAFYSVIAGVLVVLAYFSSSRAI